MRLRLVHWMKSITQKELRNTVSCRCYTPNLTSVPSNSNERKKIGNLKPTHVSSSNSEKIDLSKISSLRKRFTFISSWPCFVFGFKQCWSCFGTMRHKKKSWNIIFGWITAAQVLTVALEASLITANFKKSLKYIIRCRDVFTKSIANKIHFLIIQNAR